MTVTNDTTATPPDGEQHDDRPDRYSPMPERPPKMPDVWPADRPPPAPAPDVLEPGPDVADPGTTPLGPSQDRSRVI